jgi:hypothetical protein
MPSTSKLCAQRLVVARRAKRTPPNLPLEEEMIAEKRFFMIVYVFIVVIHIEQFCGCKITTFF